MAFIVFEGLDNCGKTTMINRLSKFLKEMKIDHVRFREPGVSPFERDKDKLPEVIRDILLHKTNHKITPEVETLLFWASRGALLDTEIRPALEEKKIVLLDRFYHTTYAYQGAHPTVKLCQINMLKEMIVRGTEPDITFYLSIPMKVMYERFGPNVVKDKIEARGYLYFQTVMNLYEGMAENQFENIKNVIRIDATAPEDIVFSEIIAHLTSKGII